MKYLFRLPSFIHSIMLYLTGYRIVQIKNDDGSNIKYRWSDHYPL